MDEIPHTDPDYAYQKFTMRLLFREGSWGSLAASETYAHLEWLRIHGSATRSEDLGLAVYEL